MAIEGSRSPRNSSSSVTGATSTNAKGTVIARSGESIRVASRAFAHARAGEGPSLIEAFTYRHSGHSRADPAQYRPKGELEQWLERDPIKIYRSRMASLGFAETDLRKFTKQ